MKKIIALLCFLILLPMVTACSETPEKLYGYWKAEKFMNTHTGKPEVIFIDKNIVNIQKKKYEDVKLTKENDVWTTSPLITISDFSMTYSFKFIDDNSIEVFDNEGKKKVIKKGKYTRITKEEAEKLLTREPWGIKSKNDPF